MTMRTVFLIVLLLTGDAFADEPLYWETRLSTFDNAKDVDVTSSTDFWTKTVTYSLNDFEPKDILKSYRSHFSKEGWNPGFSEGGWMSKSVRVTEENQPRSILGFLWSHDNKGGVVSLKITLTDYNKNKDSFKGTVSVSLSHHPMNSPVSSHKLSSLLLEDPKNIFILHNALGFDPANISQVKLPGESNLEKEGLLERYYSIVREIREDFRKLAQ